MNTTAEIYLWGTRVGIIHQDLDKPYDRGKKIKGREGRSGTLFPMPRVKASVNEMLKEYVW